MGSFLSTMNVDIFDMVFTNKIFHAENSGSKLHLNSTVVRDIDIDSVWTGVHVVDSAKAILDECVFDKNHNFESLVHAQESAEVQIMNSLFEGNVGQVSLALWFSSFKSTNDKCSNPFTACLSPPTQSPSFISNAVYALLGANINLSRTKFNDNTNQTVSNFSRGCRVLYSLNGAPS